MSPKSGQGFGYQHRQSGPHRAQCLCDFVRLTGLNHVDCDAPGILGRAPASYEISPRAYAQTSRFAPPLILAAAFADTSRRALRSIKRRRSDESRVLSCLWSRGKCARFVGRSACDPHKHVGTLAGGVQVAVNTSFHELSLRLKVSSCPFYPI